MNGISTKVTGAAVAAAVSIIIVWVLGSVGVDVPEAVSGAFTVILTFLGGFVIPEKRSSDL